MFLPPLNFGTLEHTLQALLSSLQVPLCHPHSGSHSLLHFALTEGPIVASWQIMSVWKQDLSHTPTPLPKATGQLVPSYGRGQRFPTLLRGSPLPLAEFTPLACAPRQDSLSGLQGRHTQVPRTHQSPPPHDDDRTMDTPQPRYIVTQQ